MIVGDQQNDGLESCNDKRGARGSAAPRQATFKSAAKKRSAELIADFENQMGQEFAFDQDEVWAAAMKAVEPHVAKAQAQIEARCRELGIPTQFAPGVGLNWHARGYANSVAKRRAQLRRMAETQIMAIEAKAITQIEVTCLEAQTQLCYCRTDIRSGARIY